MSALLIFIGVLFLLLFLNVPVFVSLGVSSLVVWVVSFGTFAPEMLMQKMYVGVDSFTLMAIPLFMLTGELMNRGGVSTRLIDFAQSMVGWVRGGLGFVVVVTCMFLAAILGSASACASMVGAVLIPAMVKRGYSKDLQARSLRPPDL